MRRLPFVFVVVAFVLSPSLRGSEATEAIVASPQGDANSPSLSLRGAEGDEAVVASQQGDANPSNMSLRGAEGDEAIPASSEDRFASLATTSNPTLATTNPGVPLRDDKPPLFGRALAFAQPESVWDQEWQKVRARIAATDQVELRFLTRGERGGEEQILHDLRRGRAQMGGMSLQGLASTVPELNIAMAPFVFSSIEEVDFVYDNYLFELFDELFAEKNLALLQWVEVGWNGIYAQKAIRVPADAEGLRLRGSPNPAAQLFLDAIGADSIPLGSGDLVPSLQTGLINGGVSAVIFHYFVTRRYASHVALLNHSYDTGAIVVNRQWYEGATPEQQAILRTSWGSAAEARIAVRSLIDKAIGGMAAEGIVLVEPTEAEFAQWREATAHIVPELIERIGGRSQEVYDAIEAGKAAFRRQQEAAASAVKARDDANTLSLRGSDTTEAISSESADRHVGLRPPRDDDGAESLTGSRDVDSSQSARSPGGDANRLSLRGSETTEAISSGSADRYVGLRPPRDDDGVESLTGSRDVDSNQSARRPGGDANRLSLRGSDTTEAISSASKDRFAALAMTAASGESL